MIDFFSRQYLADFHWKLGKKIYKNTQSQSAKSHCFFFSVFNPCFFSIFVKKMKKEKEKDLEIKDRNVSIHANDTPTTHLIVHAFSLKVSHFYFTLLELG